MKDNFAAQMPKSEYAEIRKDFFDIPYDVIVPKKTKNLLVSGRAISAEHLAMSASRVIATCFAVSEAAGTAAGICVQNGVVPKNLDVKLLQKETLLDGNIGS